MLLYTNYAFIYRKAVCVVAIICAHTVQSKIIGHSAVIWIFLRLIMQWTRILTVNKIVTQKISIGVNVKTRLFEIKILKDYKTFAKTNTWDSLAKGDMFYMAAWNLIGSSCLSSVLYSSRPI